MQQDATLTQSELDAQSTEMQWRHARWMAELFDAHLEVDRLQSLAWEDEMRRG